MSAATAVNGSYVGKAAMTEVDLPADPAPPGDRCIVCSARSWGLIQTYMGGRGAPFAEWHCGECGYCRLVALS